MNNISDQELMAIGQEFVKIFNIKEDKSEDFSPPRFITDFGNKRLWELEP